MGAALPPEIFLDLGEIVEVVPAIHGGSTACVGIQYRDLSFLRLRSRRADFFPDQAQAREREEFVGVLDLF